MGKGLLPQAVITYRMKPKDTDLSVTLFNLYWFHSKINPTFLPMTDMREVFINQLGNVAYQQKRVCQVAAQSFWGSRAAESQLAVYTNTSELTMKFEYQW